MTIKADEVKVNEMRQKIIDEVIRIEEEPVREMKIPEGFSLGGWVYVLSNEAMPGIYKIGMTTSTPEIRAREVSQGTGVPLPYVVELAYFSESPRNDEASIHEYLGDCRINSSREFFKCDLDEIVEACEGCGLHERDAAVERIADRCDVITFDHRNTLNLTKLFEEIGIDTFGNEYAIAEGLIRMAARTVKRQAMDGLSLLIHDGKVTRIVQEITQQYEAYCAAHPDYEPRKLSIYKTPF
ncbi:GIY-YIG nuclease family protein [Serratia sp. N21D137]|jgi:hypothetical protein|uniref:GIY-YIG nuclease family protein n=1 Tax=Serratia sp. N21D137 TaxID=3397495 RepID=UPI0039E17D30